MVEVMLGVVILSIVLAAAYTLGNRATRIGGDASEKTMVANLLQEQVERIKAAKKDETFWTNNINSNLYPSPGSPNFNTCSPPASGTSAGNPFRLNDGPLSVEIVNAGNLRLSNFYDVWIEGYQYAGYADFYVRACWQSRGGGTVEKRADMFIRVNL